MDTNEKSPPAPEEIRATRKQAGLTQREAADLVCSTSRRWIEWEGGIHRMHPGLWKLFRLLTSGGQRRRLNKS